MRRRKRGLKLNRKNRTGVLDSTRSGGLVYVHAEKSFAAERRHGSSAGSSASCHARSRAGRLPSELLVVRTSVGDGRIVGIGRVKRVYSYYFGTVFLDVFSSQKTDGIILHLLKWILSGCTASCCRRSSHVSTERCIHEPPYVTTCSSYASCRESAVLFSMRGWLMLVAVLTFLPTCFFFCGDSDVSR